MKKDFDHALQKSHEGKSNLTAERVYGFEDASRSERKPASSRLLDGDDASTSSSGRRPDINKRRKNKMTCGKCGKKTKKAAKKKVAKKKKKK